MRETSRAGAAGRPRRRRGSDARGRAPATAGGWALASAVVSASVFAALFVTLVVVACALDTTSCS